MNETPRPLTVSAMMQVGRLSGALGEGGSKRVDDHARRRAPTFQPNARHLAANGSSSIVSDDTADRLQLVVIDDGAQILEAVMAGEQRRFPHRAFVAFAVAQHDEDALACRPCA